MLSRRLFLISLACAPFAPVVSAQEKPMFYAEDGRAMSGYDAVSYFGSGIPELGQPNIALMWKGAVWQFASEENRDRFERNPRAYAPQFGGYCAYAMAKGLLSSTDPKSWRIVDGRLYLTHSEAIERVWEQDVTRNIRAAEEYWPAVLYQ